MSKAFSRKNLWESMPVGIKTGVGRVAGLIPTSFLLGRRFRESLAIARRADSWSIDEATAYQIDQLRKICLLADSSSPHYRDCFQQFGFNPSKLRYFSDMEALPLIDKHVINNETDGMAIRSESDAGVDRVATGGSSGEPLRFLIGSDRSAPEFAHLVSAWERIGYNLATPQAVLRGQVIADRSGLHHYYDPLLRRHNYSNFYMDDESMGRYLDHMATIGDFYLHTYPSSLNMLVRFIRRSGHPIPPNLRGLLVGSENVYAEDRLLAEQTLGVKYFSWYGHSEKLVFASECEQSGAYHVSPSYGFCELIGDDGKQITTPGKRGEIVGTGFINTVMPFIRYRTGDYATYVADRCDKCGRNHTVIDDIRGHNTLEMLVAVDGSLIPWAACNVHDNTFDSVLQFQFFQKEPGLAVLKVVPSNPNLSASELNVEAMNERLQGRVRISIQIVKQIPLTRNGKSVFVDQQLDTDKILQEGIK